MPCGSLPIKLKSRFYGITYLIAWPAPSRSDRAAEQDRGIGRYYRTDDEVGVMPRGMGRGFREIVSGLLLLTVLFVSIAQAHANACLFISNVGHADCSSRCSGGHEGALFEVRPQWAATHDGAYGLMCCCSSECSMMLPGSGTAMPAIVSATLVYPDRSTTRPDDLRFAPTLPPPRAIL
jgi:hypothetical protein